jgi:hypothetical protein
MYFEFKKPDEQRKIEIETRGFINRRKFRTNQVE